MSDLPARIAALSSAKRELLARRLREGRAAAALPKRAGTEPAPLSFAQERLWFLDQLEPGSVAYNICQALPLKGPLDVQILRRAFDALVARHEPLRTHFRAVDGKPVQEVGPPRPFGLAEVDLSRRAEGERQVEAQRLARQEAQRPLDLGRAPLLRALLIRLAPNDHLLVVTTHHIVSDGWSVAVLFLDLHYLYLAFAAGEPPALPELPIQYADFAVWQREQLQEAALELQLAYWREQLRGSPPALELPYDRPRPHAPTHRGGAHRVEWPRALHEALGAVARQAQATPFMALFAAFAVLLHRYTGEDDILVGTPIAGRTRVETEGLLGFFVNTLVLRTHLRGNPTFVELLARVRDTALAAYEHQDLPFDRLVAELQPERGQGQMPLVQVMFGFQQASAPFLALAAQGVSPVQVETQAAKLDLAFELLASPSGLATRIEYSAERFEASTIARLAEHYRVLLEGIAADPQARISDLPLLTPDERRHAIAEKGPGTVSEEVPGPFSAPETDYLAAPSVGQLFEARAAQAPDAVAVVAGDATLTYGELNARANQLAHRLRALGVGPDALVGVCVERSPAMAVAFLGVLKAGGAYVPLDPRYPAARLARMLEETQAPVVVTQERLRGRLPAHEAAVVCLDPAERGPGTASGRVPGPFSAGGEANPPPVAGPDSLAYVIYTSGSTGRPKGVAVPHRAILRLVVNTDYIALEPSDVVAQASNISFDAATFEIWGPLLNGASFTVIPTEVLLSPRDLAAALDRQGVTTLFVTTALFNKIADEFPQAFRGLRCLLFGGEASDPRAVARVLRAGAPRRLLHVYGPTEATTFATWHPVERVAEGATTVPIGRPIANTRVLLLDRYQNPVPVGAPGELHIGGPGLARGYVASPDLTAARFVPDPFGDEPGARLYRTGDLGRRLSDGAIELLGRLDDQVKIRGFRVEPAEIEAVLRQHQDIRDAVVMAREDTPGDKRLAAYLVPSGQARPADAELKAFLGESLPEYMIPSAFVTLDRLPLTPNGKVDRAALPAPDWAAMAGKATRRAPQSLLEQELARVWEDVLGIPRIGVTESFFDLGGHSLLAVRLFARIERVLGSKLPIATLFQAPTIEKLAAVLGRQGCSGVPLPAVALATAGAGRPFFCVTPLDAFTFLPLARQLGADRPFYALHPLGSTESEAPTFDLPALAARYIAEMRRIQSGGPYLLGGHSVGGVVAFEMAQQLVREGQRVALLAFFDTLCPARGWVQWVNRLGRRRIVRDVRTLWRLGRGKRLRYVLERLRARREPPPAGPADLEDVAPTDAEPVRRFWLPLLRAYGRALRQYPLRPYAGRMALYICAKERKEPFDPRLLWRKLAAGGTEIHRIPGDHGTMMQEPQVGVLAEALRAGLAAADARAAD